jgi:hypothetical protein
MAADGYRLALLEDATGTGRTVAAFRVLEILHAGQMLDVDDLAPDSARRSLAPATASSTGSSPTRDPWAAIPSSSTPARTTPTPTGFPCGTG